MTVTRYLVEKGSVTVDGVSLTVTEVADDGFAVSLIPETLRRTTLGAGQVGEPVNLEVDVIAKYVESAVARLAPRRRYGDPVSGTGAPVTAVDATGLRLAIVATRWHEEITGALLDSAVRTARECGIHDPTVLRDPGRRRASGRRAGARRHPRRRRLPRARAARRHPAFRVRLRRRDGRLPAGVARHRDPGRLRRPHLRHRAAGADRSGLPGAPEDKGREATAGRPGNRDLCSATCGRLPARLTQQAHWRRAFARPAQGLTGKGHARSVRCG